MGLGLIGFGSAIFALSGLHDTVRFFVISNDEAKYLSVVPAIFLALFATILSILVPLARKFTRRPDNLEDYPLLAPFLRPIISPVAIWLDPELPLVKTSARFILSLILVCSPIGAAVVNSQISGTVIADAITNWGSFGEFAIKYFAQISHFSENVIPAGISLIWWMVGWIGVFVVFMNILIIILGSYRLILNLLSGKSQSHN